MTVTTTKKSKTIRVAVVAMAVASVFMAACSAPKQPAPQQPATPATPEEAATTQEPEPTPETPPEPAGFEPKLRPYADSPYAENIDAGLAYVVDNVGERRECNWMDYTVLDYLARKFGLDEVLALEALVEFDGLDEQDVANFKLHARMVQPGYRIDDAQIPIEHVPALETTATCVSAEEARAQQEEEAAEQPATTDSGKFVSAAALANMRSNILDDMKRVMLRAMYCDQEPVDAAFAQEIIESATNAKFLGKPNIIGGYTAAHMILAYQWLRELGCDEALPELEGAHEAFAVILTDIVEDQGVITDLGLEAMAFLCYIGHADKMKPEWIEAVAAAQMDSGAYDRSGGTEATPTPQCHTTAFALWVLLEDAMPDAPDIPWLR